MEQCKSTILKQTSHGKLMLCKGCDKYHIEFKNLKFSFTLTEFKSFVSYFRDLDGTYWTDINQATVYYRKINVPIGHKNVTTLFTTEEINELLDLCNIQNNNPHHLQYLNTERIEPALCWN